MAGRRQPIELVEANGNAHMSKADIARRKAVGVKPTKDGVKFIRAPDWMPKELREEFNALRAQLVELNIFLDLDKDTLGRYLVAMHSWVEASKMEDAAIARKDVDGAKDWGTVQERHFKQARNCANDLGLTITSRCRLVVPQKAESAESNNFLKLLEARNA